MIRVLGYDDLCQQAGTGCTFFGSEQESVSPHGFIGFLGFWADGLTRFLDPGSESSPMFTDLSARSYIDCPPPIEIARFRLCRRPPWSGTSGSASSGGNSARQLGAPTQSDGVKPRTEAFREHQTAPNVPSNNRLCPPAAPYNPRIPVFKPLRDCAVLSSAAVGFSLPPDGELKFAAATPKRAPRPN